MAHVKLTTEVADILGRATIDGNLLKLPPGRLDPKIYQAVNKAIVTAGGRWKGGKTQAHVFESNPLAKLGIALETGVVVDEKKARQAFFTPEVVADEVAFLSSVSGKIVLEPSAGGGALAKACMKAGAKQVQCIEMDQRAAETLSKQFLTCCKDFLEGIPINEKDRFERIVMNPPFTKGQDTKHVEHAVRWLKKGGQLFAIVPDKEHPKLWALGASIVKQFPMGTFRESGTEIATMLISITRNNQPAPSNP